MNPTFAAAAGRRVKASLAKVAPVVLFLVLTAGSAGASRNLQVSIITPQSGQTLSGSVSWSVSAPKGSRVDFAIDGTTKWSEYDAPYVFMGDGNYLDTTGLSNGSHVLTATAYWRDVTGSASTTVTVSNAAPTPPTPPTSSAPPTVTGTAQVGATLSASAGTWSVAPTGYTYQWQKCNSSGAGCAAISGAAATTYVPVTGDVGSTLRVTVVASNAYGSGSATSAATPAVASVATASPPTVSAAPTVSGTPAVGSTLTASTGTWTNSPSGYAFQWGACDSTGGACSSISGATASSFVPTSSQIGKTLRVTVVASNAYGSGTATSAATASVPGTSSTITAPQSSSPPTVSGTPQVGSALSASTGTWTNGPTGYAYQWQQCDSSGASCSALGGATGASFTPASAQVGSTMRVTVIASNTAGSGTATSAPTALVKAAAAAAVSLGTGLPSRLPQSSGSGGTFYVDGTKGSDSNAGTSAAPWKTINKALSSVPAAGSIINVLPGTYSSSGSAYVINFSRAASTSDPITLQAQTPGTVNITSADLTASTLGGWIHSASGLRVKGLTFKILANHTNINASGLLIENSDRIEVDDCTFNEMAEAGIKVRGGLNDGQTADDVWVIDNVFRATSSLYSQVTGTAFTSDNYYGSKGSHWIYAGQYGGNTSWEMTNGTRRLVITNNVFTGSTAGRDIELGPQAQTSYVVNNTFFGNHAISLIGTSTNAVYAAQGIELFANSSNPTYETGNNVIANNLFDDLDGHAVYGSGPSESGNVVSSNLSYNLRNGLGYQGRSTWDYEPAYGSNTLFTLGVNIADADPLFRSPSAWDFHLSTGSPALRTANPAYTYPYDADGSARPAAPAVGAFG